MGEASETPRTDELTATELRAAVVAARSARRTRRELERGRQTAVVEARRQKVAMIRTRLVTANPRQETSTDRNATKSVTFHCECESRRVQLTMTTEGQLALRISTLRNGEWILENPIDLAPR